MREMRIRSKRSWAAVAGAWLVWIALAAAAQGQETYKGRLSPVPIDAKTAPDTTGQGTASAVLAGKKLTVTGTFEGLRGAATTAQLRLGAVTGVPGPAVFDLTVAKATRGTISGSFELTAEQIDGLRKGRLYVQIQSENAPEGNLWGWLSK